MTDFQIDFDAITQEVIATLKTDFQDTLSRLKKKKDIDRVKDIIVKVAKLSVKLAQADDPVETQKIRNALASYKNALAAYTVIAAELGTKMILRAVGTAAGLIAIAAVKVFI